MLVELNCQNPLNNLEMYGKLSIRDILFKISLFLANQGTRDQKEVKYA